jgi:hypothetical protein
MTPTDPGPHHYSGAELHNEDVAHEHSDVNIRTILAFGAGMAAVVIGSALLMGIMFHALASQATARDPQLSPVAPPTGLQPKAPQLLTDEPGNLKKFREEESKKLDGYGWVDERAGITHVPIEEAKKLIVQRGLPVRATGAVEDPRTGTHAPAYGEASGGRTIQIPKSASAAQPPAAPPAGDVKK